jgi:hypothetical protein
MKKGVDDIISRKKHIRNTNKITENIERKKDCCRDSIYDFRKKYRLKFSIWSLRVLAGYIMKEKKIIESISHTEIKNVLYSKAWNRVERSNSTKTILGKSRDPE